VTLFDPQSDQQLGHVAEARSVLEANAAAARDDGMTRVADNAPAEWMAGAFDFIRGYLETHDEMFVDDLWTAGLTTPPNRKAIGPVIQRAARERLMVRSGNFRRSVSSNLSDKPIWTSLIYRGTE
jgi:hypothetical protein